MNPHWLQKSRRKKPGTLEAVCLSFFLKGDMFLTPILDIIFGERRNLVSNPFGGIPGKRLASTRGSRGIFSGGRNTSFSWRMMRSLSRGICSGDPSIDQLLPLHEEPYLKRTKHLFIVEVLAECVKVFIHHDLFRGKEIQGNNITYKTFV